MKKKVISALLASTMIVSLVACGSTGGDSSDESSKGSGTTATSTAYLSMSPQLFVVTGSLWIFMYPDAFPYSGVVLFG